MTDSPSTPSGAGSAAGPANGNGSAPDNGAPVQARIVSQFIKDLSFEVPDPVRVAKGPGENPNLQLEVNVNARHVENGRFESLIEFSANASDASGVIYHLETTYGGLFDVQRMPQDALEPFLLVNCPALVFPFLRRLVADLTRESGFPPLMLDPIDFGQLYLQRKREAAKASAVPTSNT